MKVTNNGPIVRPTADNGHLDGAYGQLVQSLGDTRGLLDVHARERLMKLVTELQSQMERKPA